MTDEGAAVLLVRSVVDTSARAREWDAAVSRLWAQIEALGGRELTPWGVQVVYVVGAGITPVDFDGVQLGAVSRKARTLVIKAAVRGPATADADAVVLDILERAVTLAESVARRRGLVQSLDAARAITEQLNG
ncbi:hypothetical protein [Cellulomonas telluris]|uniref:hypothetical protein n=1 Tax=Cellulomonas telluris TaxID=2306636 RepID=UPI0010A84D02|nr:hypothetical protein [Cellulomonas telluris]